MDIIETMKNNLQKIKELKATLPSMWAVGIDYDHNRYFSYFMMEGDCRLFKERDNIIDTDMNTLNIQGIKVIASRDINIEDEGELYLYTSTKEEAEQVVEAIKSVLGDGKFPIKETKEWVLKLDPEMDNLGYMY